MSDETALLEWAGGVVTAVGGWFMLSVKGIAKDATLSAEDARKAVADLERSTNDKISRLTDNLSDYKIFMASTIPTKTEMNSSVLRIEESVKRINERLDEIADGRKK